MTLSTASRGVSADMTNKKIMSVISYNFKGGQYNLPLFLCINKL